MADEVRPLSDEERAELEALRAEKRAREQQEQAKRERAELEALRARKQQGQARQRTLSQAEAEENRRIAAARERGARLMEPDDDLRMPMGQKIVLGVLALLVAIVAAMTFLVGR